MNNSAQDRNSANSINSMGEPTFSIGSVSPSDRPSVKKRNKSITANDEPKNHSRRRKISACFHSFRMQKSQSSDYLDVPEHGEGKAIETRNVGIQTINVHINDDDCPESSVDNQTKLLRRMMSKSLNLIYCASDDAYVIFLKNHQCSELMPTSGKVLVLDSALSIKKAFYALVFNNTRAALISTVDRKNRPQFTGVLSISDFLELITLYYRSRHQKIRELEELSIRSWKNQLNSNAAPRSIRALPGIAGGGATRHLIRIPPTLSLFDTCALLERERVHRIPIIDPHSQDFLYFVTMKRILRFLFLAIYNIPRPDFLDKTIDELRIGSFCADFATRQRHLAQSSTPIDSPSRNFKKIYTITKRTSIIEALRLLVRTGVSALPVVDTTGRLRDLFSRFDVIHLAVTGSYTDLDKPVESVMKSRRNRIEPVLCCHLEETLITIMVRICVGQVHRLVIVDKTRRVIGILSLSDLMIYLTRAAHS